MRSTFYKAWSIAILSVSVLIFCLTIFLVLGQNNNPKVLFSLNPEKTEVKVGDKVTVAVKFAGVDGSEVSATDIFINYDTEKLKLVGGMAGPYFPDPLIVSWEIDAGRFAIASKPNTKHTGNTDLSVVRLEFTALKQGEAEISFADKSTAYVAGIGEVSPRGGTSPSAALGTSTILVK